MKTPEPSPQRLHRHLVEGVFEILQSIFDGSYADKAIERSFHIHKKWGARDRHFVAETSYECTRWWTKIWHALGVDESSCLSKGFFSAKNTKRWDFFRAYLEMRSLPPPPWPELASAQPADWRRIQLDSSADHAMPSWLFAKGQQELGESWLPMLRALNRKAPVALRTNRLKTTRDLLKARLQSEGVESLTDERYPEALILKERTNVFRLPSFHDGLFEVQDCGSQTIAPFLDPRPGERIADGCAGAGGKSLHLAALMQNKGKIIAMDVHEWKLKELKARAARNGVDIIETRVVESTKTLKRMEGHFSGVLLDVPCSGVGALRRNPDSKWKLQPETFADLHSLQRKILEDNKRLVAPRGRLVYSTCSVFPSENEHQVQWFLETHPDFVLIKEHWERPHQQGFDGFYMALLEKRN